MMRGSSKHWRGREISNLKRQTSRRAFIIGGAATLAAAPASAFEKRPFDGTKWVNAPVSSPSGVRHETFHSRAMNAGIGFNIYLPPGYGEQTSRRYPVVYVLHGMNGDENSLAVSLDDLIASGAIAPMIAVFPNGGKNSKYMDAAPHSRMRGVVMVETAIMRELLPYIDSRYRTRASRDGRAIAGFSMGGMGALRLAFKYPDSFAAVIAQAPAVLTYAHNIRSNDPQVLSNMFRNRPALWTPNTALALARRNAGRIRGRMPIFLSIGEYDSFLKPYVTAFSEALTRARLPHEFRLHPRLGHEPVARDIFIAGNAVFNGDRRASAPAQPHAGLL